MIDAYKRKDNEKGNGHALQMLEKEVEKIGGVRECVTDGQDVLFAVNLGQKAPEGCGQRDRIDIC
jgi:hypothetical protein